MKKHFLWLFIIAIASSSSFAQSTEVLQRLLNDASKAFAAKDYKKAESIYKKAVDESVRVLGIKHRETGVTYLNLAEIQLAQKKFKESKTNFKAAISVLMNDSSKNKLLIWRAHVLLVSGAAFNKRKKEGIAFLADAKAFVDETFEPDSPAVLNYQELEQNFHVALRDFERADQIFRDRYRTLSRIRGKNSPEVRKLRDDYMCYSLNNFGDKGNERIKLFSEFIESVDGKDATDLGESALDYATSLPQPSNPNRSSKVVIIPVRIIVNPNGIVKSARSVCGAAPYRESSEAAALKAKFRIKKPKGKPQQMTGTIFYRYAPLRRRL